MRSFEADEKIIIRNSSSERCGYFVFIDIQGYLFFNISLTVHSNITLVFFTNLIHNFLLKYVYYIPLQV